MRKVKRLRFRLRVENIIIYNAKFKHLSKKYDFPIESNKNCKFLMNGAAYIYLSLMGEKWLKLVLPQIENEITNLQTQAYKFSYALKPLLKWGSEYDLFFDNDPITDILEQTNDRLKLIMTFKEKLRNNTIEQMASLGSNTPKENLALLEFIKLMWEFWHDILGRNLVQKYDGLNGRKRLAIIVTINLE